MQRISGALVLVAAFGLASCESMPAWIPFSGAISVNLTGDQQVPPVSVAGTGSGSFRDAEDGTLSGSVTTDAVEGTMAHIHQGVRGTNGPVIVPLDKKGDSYSVPAGRKLTPAQVEALKAGNLYVNVHTNRNKAGEIRAQLLP